MNQYLLDTDVCIYFLKGEYQLNEKVAAVGLENCFLSEITIAELTYGVANASPKYKPGHQEALVQLKLTFKDRIIPINSCFEVYADEKVRLKKAGTPIGEFDLFIGASAITNNLIMVTGNEREFSRLENLTVENWIKN